MGMQSTGWFVWHGYSRLRGVVVCPLIIVRYNCCCGMTIFALPLGCGCFLILWIIRMTAIALLAYSLFVRILARPAQRVKLEFSSVHKRTGLTLMKSFST